MVIARRKELALFDLDGTLVDLKIDRDEFEKLRSSWAAYLSSRGAATTLKPLLPELQRIAQTAIGRRTKADILNSFDELELSCQYSCLGRIDRVIDNCKSHFRKLMLVTHNSRAFWSRLAREHHWPHLFDSVITRDEMKFFKPDLRACESAFRELTVGVHQGECWVIGNSEADRGLGMNLRRAYAELTVRTIMVNSARSEQDLQTDQLEVSVRSVDSLLDLLEVTSSP